MDRRTFVESLGVAVVPMDRLLRRLAEFRLPPTLTDYGFSPGGTRFDLFGRLNLGKRPNTCLIILPDPAPVSAFIDFLKSPGAIDPADCGPVLPRTPDEKRYLLVVSHANNRGQMMIGLDPTHYSVKSPLSDTEYEDIERALFSHTIEIPANLPIDGVAVTASSTAFRIMGCRIGTSKAFLEKLKEALGGRIPVIAPNHIHWISFGELPGSLDCMLYHFEYTTLGPKTHAELVTAFQQRSSAAFTALRNGVTTGVNIAYRTWWALNGSGIPDSNWAVWIPKPLPKARTVYPPFEASFKQRVNQLPSAPSFRLGEFRQRLDLAGPFIVTGGSSKANEPNADARRAFIRPFLEADARFRHATYPYHARHNTASLQEFVDTFQWYAQGYAPLEKKKKMKQSPDVWWGRRLSYSVLQPITDSDRTLIYNYYGLDGSIQTHLDACLTDPARATVKDLLFTTV